MLTNNLKTIKGRIIESNKLISETGKIYKIANIFIPFNEVYVGYFQISILDEKWSMLIRKIVVEKRDAK